MAELKRVGNYEILGRIGRGGMGAVFRARQINMDRVIALKILPPSLAKQPTFIERFLREARASAKLNHPNIVNGIDVGHQGGLYYFAMEYIEGSSLKSVIDKQERLPEKRALEIARDISLALDHAHSHGILHRDIKPDNILIDKNGTAKLCDLGLAHLATESEEEKSLTQDGRAVGTPHYISPEQARGADLDATTDLYSLGATIYHMVAGVTVFQGATSVVIMTKHLSEKPVDPSEFGAELSEGLLKIIGKLLQKNRTDRYPSARKLADDLERVLQHKEPKFADIPKDKWPFKKTSAAGGGAAGDAAASRKAIIPGSALEKSSHNLRVPRRGTRVGVPGGGIPVAAFIGLGVVLMAVLVFLLTASDGESKAKMAAVPVKAPVVAEVRRDPVPAAPTVVTRPADAKDVAERAVSAKPEDITPAPRTEEIAPRSTETLDVLSNIPKSRVVGDASVDPPPAIETPALVRPSIHKAVSEARVMLNSKQYKATLAKVVQIRADFAGSGDLNEQATELARIEKAAKEGDAPPPVPPAPPAVVAVAPPPVIPAPIDVKAPEVKPVKPEAAKVAEAPKPAKAKTVSLLDKVVRDPDILSWNSFSSSGKSDLYYSGWKSGAVDFVYQPPEEYDYKLVFKCETPAAKDKNKLSPYGYVMMYVPIGGKSLVCYMPFGTNGQYAFDYINRTRFRETSNITRREYTKFKVDTEYTAVLNVRRDSVTLTIDGEIVTGWRRDGVSPTAEGDPKLSDSKNLGVGGTNHINLHVTEASITELPGPELVTKK